jgi:tripartite-type tricarboxylate transporter receptor subunit TctC
MMKTQKKYFVMIFCFSLLMLLINSSEVYIRSAESASINYPSKPIEIIVCYSAGGSSDLATRIIASYVEKILGVPVSVINVTGASGWTGWLQLLRSPADGYVLSATGMPNFITGYLNPQMGMEEDLDSFEYIAHATVNYCVVSVQADEKKFSTFKEFIEYAKENELVIACGGVGSPGHISMLKINEKFGTKLTALQIQGASEGLANLMGRHVDGWICSISDGYVPTQNGEIKSLATVSKERSPFLPNVPTIKELTGEEIVMWSGQGFVAPAGVEQDIMKILIDAFSKAINDPECNAKMRELGMTVEYHEGNEYKAFMSNLETDLKQYLGVLGWQ